MWIQTLLKGSLHELFAKINSRKIRDFFPENPQFFSVSVSLISISGRGAEFQTRQTQNQGKKRSYKKGGGVNPNRKKQNNL